MSINATIYVEDIDSRGGCFTYWPGSHVKAAEYFRSHSLLSVPGGSSKSGFDIGEGVEFTGKAGDVCLWHGQMFHSGTKNVNRNIRRSSAASSVGVRGFGACEQFCTQCA